MPCPMLFRLTNTKADRATHCGVLESEAEEGVCYLPPWMMQNLSLEAGGLVQVESVHLPVGTSATFQPQSPDFLSITSVKAVLENALRNYPCLTTGDVIAIKYNEKIYELQVVETKPEKAVSITDCDLEVDFVAPVGPKEPEGSAQQEETTDAEGDPSGRASDAGFHAFSGPGYRLDSKKEGAEPSAAEPGAVQREIPNHDFQMGKITFDRNSHPPVQKDQEEKSGSHFTPFLGEGHSLEETGGKP